MVAFFWGKFVTENVVEGFLCLSGTSNFLRDSYSTMKRSLDEFDTTNPKKYKTEETLKRKCEFEWIPTKKLKVPSERTTLGELQTDNRLQEVGDKEHRLILFPKRELQYSLEPIPFPLYREIEYPPDPSQLQVVLYNKVY
jgi:hypothetical protein